MSIWPELRTQNPNAALVISGKAVTTIVILLFSLLKVLKPL